MLRECWIVLSAVVWTICVFLVLQYWSTLLRIDEQILTWNDFPTNSTVQKTNFISTKQTSSEMLRSSNSSSMITRNFGMFSGKIGQAILSLNSIPSISSESALLTINSKSTTTSTAFERRMNHRSFSSSLKSFHHSIHLRKPSTNFKKTTSSSRRFIYLIQTDNCLAEHLLQPGVFGDGCKNDILVLSWQQPCTSNFSSRFKHVKYIYKANNTWGEGRNILYYSAKKIPKSYLYYIFMDGDLSFRFTNSVFKERYRNLGIRWPLRAFEDFLLKYEPAVGVPLYCSRCLRLNKITGKPKTLCCDPVKDLKPLPEYLPVTIHFDAAFNAFHRNAVGHILPYRLDNEHRSWWQSQKYVILAAELMFRGQVLRFSAVTVLNHQHREYPRGDWENWSRIYNILKAEMPRKYRQHFYWTPDHSTVNVRPIVRNNTVITPMWNVEIPTGKITVEPFKYLNT